MSTDAGDADPSAQDDEILSQARHAAEVQARLGNHARAREILAEAVARLTSRELAAVVSAELLPRYARVGASARLAPLANTTSALRSRLRLRRASSE